MAFVKHFRRKMRQKIVSLPENFLILLIGKYYSSIFPEAIFTF